jgi:phage terminase small subunit
MLNMKKELNKQTPKPRHQKKHGPTLKQWIFIKEVAAGVSGAEAVRRAGFKTNRPDSYAYELRRKHEISDAIETLKAERLKKYDITAERVLEELALIGYQNAQNLYDPETGALIPIHKLPESVARTIASIEVVTSLDENKNIERTIKLKTWDKKGSLELLGRHLKMWTDKIEATGKDGQPLIGCVKVFFGKESKAMADANS